MNRSERFEREVRGNQMPTKLICVRMFFGDGKSERVRNGLVGEATFCQRIGYCYYDICHFHPSDVDEIIVHNTINRISSFRKL